MAINVNDFIKDPKLEFSQEQIDKAMEDYFLEMSIEDVKAQFLTYEELTSFEFNIDENNHVTINAKFDINKKSNSLKNELKIFTSKEKGKADASGRFNTGLPAAA